MNTPASPSVAPKLAVPAVPAAPLKAHLRGTDKQHNREIGHFLKSASQHRAMPARSMSHSRGR